MNPVPCKCCGRTPKVEEKFGLIEITCDVYACNDGYHVRGRDRNRVIMLWNQHQMLYGGNRWMT